MPPKKGAAKKRNSKRKREQSGSTPTPIRSPPAKRQKLSDVITAEDIAAATAPESNLAVAAPAKRKKQDVTLLPAVRTEDPDIVYEHQEFLGEGGNAEVTRILNKRNGVEYALKKIMKTEGKEKQLEIKREIDILKTLEHKNIIKMNESYSWKGEVFLVLELCLMHVSELMQMQQLNSGHKKFLMYYTIKGLDHLHWNNILHRDVKPENILLTQEGVVKLADFGSARLEEQDIRRRRHTCEVTTLPYSAPEMNLENTKYGKPVDVWATGCLMGELYKEDYLFWGDSHGKNHLMAITEVCGDMPDLPGLGNPFGLPSSRRIIKEVMEQATGGDKVVAEFVDEMLKMNPSERPNTTQLLHHCVWTTEPKPMFITIPKPDSI